MTRIARYLRRAARALAAACVALPVATTAIAATTDLASSPLFTSSVTAIKPNIMVILDDSGSMARDYVPDDAGFATTKYGRTASQCNGMAYNPSVVYSPPVDSTGASLPNADSSQYIANPIAQTTGPKRNLSSPLTMPASVGGSLTVTVTNGSKKSSWYDPSEIDNVTFYQDGDTTRWISGTVVSWNKSTGALKITVTEVHGSGSFTAGRVGYGWVDPADYYKYTGSQKRLSYTYNSSGVITSTTFYKECNSNIGSSPGSSVFTKVDITVAEAQNYANWYQYYKTRMQMMQTAASLAFKNITDKYRIGYSTISKDDTSEDDDFLNIRDFNATQKSNFYAKFNSASPNGYTPLRAALSKAGQYFAHKAKSQTLDPVQYSCQRNFAILETDGYWNTQDEESDYGPFKVNNSTNVGQQDGTGTLRPMFDGSPTNSTSDSLADIAAYYYNTDLRDSSLSNCTGALGTEVCTNNVPGNKSDSFHSFGDQATWQHMTTFTMGLGVSGILRYDPNYTTQLSGDFYDIVTGAKNWPVAGSTKSPENIDDLWHAAVNGRGEYFSANDPASLLTAFSQALNKIDAKVGSASAASTSSLHPVAGDNEVYVAQFTTQKWIGDVLSYTIDPDSGAISAAPTWSAASQLNLKTPASRKIYYKNPSGSTTPRDFTYANLTTDGMTASFTNFCSKTAASGSGNPVQCPTLADPTAANTGSNLVSYLRGDQSLTYYRTREGVLGDIINASPLFIGKPSFKYTENNYTTFATNNASRQGIVLAAANDGMVHAFKRETGDELWAYIPTAVIPNLYKLADTGYADNHRYSVDGALQIGDIYVGGVWKTIVVGGLGGGGRSYYALDVTDTTAPKVLWEYSANDLGYTYGNPVITKRADGTWVVVFGSGYNNVSPGDGNGHLFVLNANTGALLTTVDTMISGSPAGTTGTPSGLSRIQDWVDLDTNNSAKRFYGGDLLGNVWRFDIDNLVAPNGAALRLAQLTNPSGGAEPITTLPAVAEIIYNNVRYPVVYVGTGKYLGTSDLSDTSVQSIYAIKDPLTNSSYGTVRGNTNFVQQTFTAGAGGTRSVTNNPVDWSAKAGWYGDFPQAGERISINPALVLSTLTLGTNLPNSNTCSVGGTSFIYNLNIATGSTAEGETDAGYTLGDVLVQGLTVVQLKDGSTETLITRSDAKLATEKNAPAGIGTTPKRTSWRELAD
ncbi:MAG TPA: PilC/PilY family type IV pilus protein [Ramlibacter sp.]|uniref:pilus assembly protein n=1 Tax=Ramlibacter sp. TaxID=1917967 RepID=UPI002CBA8B1B|nr:PilC/PilY family type IV pilus protein [Ramlibacter sp.]HVZ46844.1 PilC/PilY family type IV pilus protein [Ramlibacter sp.]